MATFTNELQETRFKRELELLEDLKNTFTITAKKSSLGYTVQISMENQSFFGFDSKSLVFEIHLHGKFPLQQPKVMLETVIGFPSIADGRDLLEDIIRRKWDSSITAYEIINLLVNFISSSQNQISLIGKYHLGHPYFLDSWEVKESMGAFPCIEVDPLNPKFNRERAIVITHTMVLQFDINPHLNNVGHLIFWATLQSIEAISKSKIDPDRLNIQWKRCGKIQGFCQQFRVFKSKELVELILSNVEKLGVSIKKEKPKTPTLQEEDVNVNSLERINVKEILEKINETEKDIENGIYKDKINSLISLYQQATEYFSALNDPQFDIYLQKMLALFKNEQYMKILREDEEVEKKEENSEKDEEVKEQVGDSSNEDLIKQENSKNNEETDANEVINEEKSEKETAEALNKDLESVSQQEVTETMEAPQEFSPQVIEADLQNGNVDSILEDVIKATEAIIFENIEISTDENSTIKNQNELIIDASLESLHETLSEETKEKILIEENKESNLAEESEESNFIETEIISAEPENSLTEPENNVIEPDKLDNVQNLEQEEYKLQSINIKSITYYAEDNRI
ncbi:unnamed protein product [Blepharisma stoltei]|uniref:UBC core domain-containing protein n=1 Tax=Blepharisma stoltei TaxID=1481888 RepID=A0AAU9IGW6_9CILI|nr:unnamed protein product [Blepharisma stoltei]